MPTPYLQKLHDEHGIPIEKLEAYWARAKEIAKKSNHEENYPVITTIFKNMLSMSLESTSDAFHDPKEYDEKKDMWK